MFSIGKVQEETGLTGRQIRYYEKAGLIKPYRTEGKQRRYTEKDIDILIKIKSLIKEGYQLEGIKDKLQQEFEEDIVEETDIFDNEATGAFSLSKKVDSLYPASDRAGLVKKLTKKDASELD